jgi:hypothetical protein
VYASADGETGWYLLATVGSAVRSFSDTVADQYSYVVGVDGGGSPVTANSNVVGPF